MTLEFEAAVPVRAAMWTPAAVSSLIGQRPRVDGQPAEVVAARLDGRGMLYITLRVGQQHGPGDGLYRPRRRSRAGSPMQ